MTKPSDLEVDQDQFAINKLLVTGAHVAVQQSYEVRARTLHRGENLVKVCVSTGQAYSRCTTDASERVDLTRIVLIERVTATGSERIAHRVVCRFPPNRCAVHPRQCSRVSDACFDGEF